MKPRERMYRINRYAAEAEHWQMLVNIMRRLCFRPIRQHSGEAAREARIYAIAHMDADGCLPRRDALGTWPIKGRD